MKVEMMATVDGDGEERRLGKSGVERRLHDTCFGQRAFRRRTSRDNASGCSEMTDPGSFPRPTQSSPLQCLDSVSQ